MSEALKINTPIHEDPFLVELRTHLIGSYIAKLQKLRSIIEGPALNKESFFGYWDQDFADFPSEVSKMKWPYTAKIISEFSEMEKKLMAHRLNQLELPNLMPYKESLLNLMDTLETIFVSLEKSFFDEKWLYDKYISEFEGHHQLIINLCKLILKNKNKKIIEAKSSVMELIPDLENISLPAVDKIFMIVNIKELEIAIPIEEVQEVVNQREITRLPDGNSNILGLINLRGDPVPLLDIFKLWNLPNLQESYFLICHKKNKKFGIQVHSADQVKTINTQKILPAKDLVGLPQSELIQGVFVENEKQILIIDFNV